MNTPKNLAVIIYTPSAPSHGRARGWVRNVNIHVLVVDADRWTGTSTIRSPAIAEQHTVAWGVDSRYTGPRSTCGQALAAASELAETLALQLDA